MRISIKENSEIKKKELSCFHLYNNMQRSIILFDILHEILFQSVLSHPDSCKRTDEKNLSPPKKTVLVPTAKTF